MLSNSLTCHCSIHLFATMASQIQVVFCAVSLSVAPSDSLEQHSVQHFGGCSWEEEWSPHHSSFCAGKHPRCEPAGWHSTQTECDIHMQMWKDRLLMRMVVDSSANTNCRLNLNSLLKTQRERAVEVVETVVAGGDRKPVQVWDKQGFPEAQAKPHLVKFKRVHKKTQSRPWCYC